MSYYDEFINRYKKDKNSIKPEEADNFLKMYKLASELSGADPSYEAKEGFDPDKDAWDDGYKRHRKRIIFEKLKSDPSTVSEEERQFFWGDTDKILPKQQSSKEEVKQYFRDENKYQLFQKQKAYNLVNNKKYKFYDPSFEKEDFLNDVDYKKNVFVSDKGMSAKEAREIAEKEGKNEFVFYDSDKKTWAHMKNEDFDNLSKGWTGGLFDKDQALYNIQANGAFGILKQAGKDMLSFGGSVIDAPFAAARKARLELEKDGVDTFDLTFGLPNPAEMYENFKEADKGDKLKALNPFYNFSRKELVNTGKAFIDLAKNNRKGEILKEAGKDFIKSFDGTFGSGKEESVLGKDILIEHNDDVFKDGDFATSALGFGVDITTGLNPIGSSSTVALKGGKLVLPKLASKAVKSDVVESTIKQLEKKINPTTAREKELFEGVAKELREKGEVDFSHYDELHKKLEVDVKKETKIFDEEHNNIMDDYDSILKEYMTEDEISKKFAHIDDPLELAQAKYDEILKQNDNLVKQGESEWLDELTEFKNKPNRNITDELSYAETSEIERLFDKYMGKPDFFKNMEKALVDKFPKAKTGDWIRLGNYRFNIRNSEKALDELKDNFMEKYYRDYGISRPAYSISRREELAYDKMFKSRVEDILKANLFRETGTGINIPFLNKNIELIPQSVREKVLFDNPFINNQLTRNLANSKVGKGLDKVAGKFSNTWNVDPRLSEKGRQEMNELMFERSKSQNRIQELLDGTTKEEREAITYYMGNQPLTRKQNDALTSLSNKMVRKGSTFPKLINEIREIFNQAGIREGIEPEFLKENYLNTVFRGKTDDYNKALEELGADFRHSDEINMGSGFNFGAGVFNRHEQRQAFSPFDYKNTSQGDKVDLDIATMLSKREIDSLNVAARNRMQEFINKEIGELNGDNKRFIDDLFSRENIKDLPLWKQGLRQGNTIWKNMIMNSPIGSAQAFRNLMGGFANNYTAGVGAKDYAKTLEFMAKNSSLARKLAPNSEIKLPDGTTMKTSELSEVMKKQGIDQGAFTTDLMNDMQDWDISVGRERIKKGLNPFNFNKGYVWKLGNALNSTVEEGLRGAKFFEAQKRLGTGDEAFNKIGQEVDNTHFNYNAKYSLSPFERELKNYYLPFYLFGRKNAELQANNMAKQSTKMNRVNLAQREFDTEEGNESDHVSFPDYLRHNVHLGDGNYLNLNMLPQNDFKDLANPIDKGVNLLNPFFKAGYDATLSKLFGDKQLGTGFNLEGDTKDVMFGGRNLYNANPELADNLFGIYENQNGELMQSSRNKAVLFDLLPDAYRLNSASNEEGQLFKDNDGNFSPRKMMKSIFGLNVQSPDIEQLNDFRVQDEGKQLQPELDKLKKRGLLTDNEMLGKQKKILNIEQEFARDSKLFHEADKKIQQGKTASERQDNGFVKSVFGNYIDYIPKTKKQYEEYDKNMKKVQEGQEKDRIMWAKYYSWKEQGSPKLSDYFKKYGYRKDPNTNEIYANDRSAYYNDLYQYNNPFRER